MQIADSTAMAVAARQSAEQIAAAGYANETKHAAPKAPRLRVETDQRQGFVEARQGFVHDRALRRDDSRLLGRCHGQHLRISAPLDSHVSALGRPNSFRRS